MATLTWWCPKHGTLQAADVLEGRDCRRCGQRAIPAPDVQRSEPDPDEVRVSRLLNDAACRAVAKAVAEVEQVLVASTVRHLAAAGVIAEPGRLLVLGDDGGRMLMAGWTFRLVRGGPAAASVDPEPGPGPGAN